MLNKDFFVIFFGKFIQVIIAIATIKISTALLPPKEMGSIYLFLTIQTFFVFTFISPLGQYTNRKTHNWNDNKTIIDNLFLLSVYILIIGIISIFVGYTLYYFFNVGGNITIKPFLLLLFGYTVLLSLNQTFIPMLNMLSFRMDFTILTILTSLGVLILGYLLINAYYPKAEVWLSAILLSNLIFAIFGYYLIKKRVNSKFSGFSNLLIKLKNYDFKSLIKILIPISIATLFMWLQNSGYRIIIEQKISLEYLGYLGVGLAVSSQIASIFESILTQYLAPIYYKKISNQTNIEDRTESFNWLLNIKLPMYFLLALYVTIFSEYLIDIVVDEEYKGVYIFTVFGIWIEFFRMMTNVLYSVSLSEFKTRKIILPYVVGSFTTIFLVYLSSGSLEYEFYLPIALVIGGIATMSLMYFEMKKLLNFTIDSKLFYISIFLSSVYCFIFIFNFDKSFINSMLIIFTSGIYFLGTIFLVYKKNFLYDNS